MRTISKISAALIILFSLVFAPACVKISVNSQDAQKYRKTADEYLKKIESDAPVQDTLAVLQDSITAVMGEDFLVYTGWSEYYQDVFSVFVNKIDGSCMDQYYRLYLKEEARGKGLASEFFDHVRSAYPEALHRLEAEHENLHAVEVYKSQGFEEMPYTELYRKPL